VLYLAIEQNEDETDGDEEIEPSALCGDTEWVKRSLGSGRQNTKMVERRRWRRPKMTVGMQSWSSCGVRVMATRRFLALFSPLVAGLGESSPS
jgi:hypothetical protein